MPTQDNLQEKKFKERLNESKIWTQMMATYLKATGHITDFRQATVEEDKNELIDYWFKYPGSDRWVPVAFKLRIDPAKRDVPVVFGQPFHGTDSEKSVSGRDYRCVTEGKAERYYVAIKNASKEYSEIYWVSKEELNKKVQELVSVWKTQETTGQFIAYDKLTGKRVESLIRNAEQGKGTRKIAMADVGEVWWQKNRTEKFSKINLYFPEGMKEGSVSIPTTTYKKMLSSHQHFTRKHEDGSTTV